MPLRWVLNEPSDWISAAADPEVSREYRLLEGIIEHVDPIFHPLLVNRRSLWRHKDPQDVISAARLAYRLEPGCAKGLPLRLLSGQGVDTKFIENNISLLTQLMDVRFSGEASEQGLTTFLGAFDESSHWVLVVPLSPGMLPFKKCRVTTAELAETPLTASRILVIENEQCLHQLPVLSDTIAILGCGLDVQWLSSSVLDEKSVAYWGDMDSWGLLMLARARLCRPTLDVLLMNRELFEQYANHSAVTEPVIAQEAIPDGLLSEEADFYRYLTRQARGRLEQEFLPVGIVGEVLIKWQQGLQEGR
nr:Wadjet anti-phage system protein JetD domain-containing protein [Mangrovibacter sp. MFB070]